jgi:hypothetical protein
VDRRPEPEPPALNDRERKRQALLLAAVIAVASVLFARWVISSGPAGERATSWIVFAVIALAFAVPIGVIVFRRAHLPPGTTEQVAEARKVSRKWLPLVIGVVAPVAVWGPDAIGWVAAAVMFGAAGGAAVGGSIGLARLGVKESRRTR